MGLYKSEFEFRLSNFLRKQKVAKGSMNPTANVAVQKMGALSLYSAPVSFKFTAQSRFTAVLVGVKAKNSLQGEL